MRIGTVDLSYIFLQTLLQQSLQYLFLFHFKEELAEDNLFSQLKHFMLGSDSRATDAKADG